MDLGHLWCRRPRRQKTTDHELQRISFFARGSVVSLLVYTFAMNTPSTAIALTFVFAGCLSLHTAPSPPPTRAEIEDGMGLRSEGDVVRGQRDTIGFVVTAAQAEDVVTTAIRLEQDTILERDRSLGLSPEQGFIGGVCPHDDHLYTARAYVHLTERITAPRVVLIGVFHAARLWGLENAMVFDDFERWHGPWGPVAIDGLREDTLEAGLGTTAPSNLHHWVGYARVGFTVSDENEQVSTGH